ncbi:MAG: hypothetical protein AAFV19_09700 [Pseudomonadota bacterium]
MKLYVCGLILFSAALGLTAAPVAAQQNYVQERVVLNAASIPVSQLPGVRLIRAGDSLLLAVRLLNDAIEPDRRREELRQTLSNMLDAAGKDQTLELSVVDPEGFVAPLTEVDQSISILGSREQRGMSHIDIRLKTTIPDDAVDGKALVNRLRGFVNSTETVGRTVVNATGAVDISILNPEQYRGDVIKLITAEIKLITTELGDDYKVVLQDLERPLEYRRVGIIDLELYIPYRFQIIPGTISSISSIIALAIGGRAAALVQADSACALYLCGKPGRCIVLLRNVSNFDA